MKLYFDTSDNAKTVIGLDEQRWSVPTKKHRSQQLLGLIDKVLQKKKKKLGDLTGIEINLGPGSFTGLKVGVAVANALSWSLKIPLNGQKKLAEPNYEKRKKR